MLVIRSKLFAEMMLGLAKAQDRDKNKTLKHSECENENHSFFALIYKLYQIE